MFIAHIPAGYLLTRDLKRRFKTDKYLWIGLIASALPVIDRSQNHHTIFTHLPIFWLTLWVITLFVYLFWRNRTLLIVSTIFFANIFLHLILDTFAAGIQWLYPWSHNIFVLVHVPSVYPFWVENFVFHWSFLVEIGIMIWALAVFLNDRKNKA